MLRLSKLGCLQPTAQLIAPTVQHSHATISNELARDVERITNNMRDALESTNYIAESAQQAYLETEPSQRELPESYRIRYMGFACSEIEHTLAKYEDLRANFGEDVMRELESSNAHLGLALADTLLARDRLRSQLRIGAQKMEDMKKGGLKKEDLTFCDS